MLSLPEYIHLEEVHNFEDSILYRAQNQNNSRPVLIKQYKKEVPEAQFKSIEKRVKAIKKLGSYLIDNPLRILHVEKKVVMTWQESGSIFLSAVLQNSHFDLDRFFRLAIHLCRRLGELHTGKIIHNDLRPQNILIDESRSKIRFSGVSFINLSASKKRKASLETVGEDLFLYTSPEQTGRINWEVDQRSDIYSLGAILYEVLVGQPPFVSPSTQKRIQSHLVIEPESIRESRDDIPEVVDNIILKCLNKSPEDRYQSVFGLLSDLETCRNNLEHNQQIQTFELGQKDNIERLSIPSKLYGSQTNFVALIESLNRVYTGSVEMMIVEGNAGMGKTTLISELLGLAMQKGAFVGRGKCEKEFRDTPYYSLISAFQVLVRNILREKKPVIANWKSKFSEALGTNGQLVVDFIPELESIIGPQPSVPNLDADEAQNRLTHIFSRFVQVFTSEGTPLVIFIDSFQWADLATIQLIQAALSDVGSRYIMLVIAIQKHLISHSHTFAMALDEISQAGTSIENLKVTPLNIDDVCLLIEDALSFKQDFRRLAQYIIDKTGGNPYFVKQFLITLYERNLIKFDPVEAQWSWDIRTIKKENLPDNVVELMAAKVNSLDPESVDILKLAACIGNQFDLKTLELASKKDAPTLRQLLKAPLAAGLIEKLTKKEALRYQIANLTGHLSKGTQIFKFAHSRVQRATYSLLKTRRRKSNHVRLGRMLLDSYSKDEIDFHAYQIVNQMNQGIQQIRKQAERHELARLNLIAGLKSQAAAAFETAWKYFSIGTELLSESSWEEDYNLTKELNLKRSECEYFIGNTEAAEPIFDQLLANIKSKRERVDVIILKLSLYIKNNRLDEAIEIGLEALNSNFGEEIPPNDAEITIVSQMKMQDIQADLEQRKIEEILFAAEMSDEDRIAMMDIITNMIPAAYIVKRNLWILLSLKMVELSLIYGNSNTSAFGFMNYAVILCSGLQDYSNGYAMGRLALDLNNRYKRISLTSQLNFLFGSYIGHWKNQAVENLSYLKRSYREGIENGDFISAGLSVDFLMKTMTIVGQPLEEIEKEAKRHQDFANQLNSPDLKNILNLSKLTTQLRDGSEDVKNFMPVLEESQKLKEEVIESKNTQLKQWYYLLNAKTFFLFYNNDEALRLIQESDKLIGSYSQLAISEHYFYYSTIIIENYNNFNEEEKKRYWDILKNNHQRLINLADNCKINFSDKALLVSALMAGISGNYIKAGDLFDEAIQQANKNGFVQIEAIANELAAKYYLSKDKHTIASAYIKKASLAYIKWGALRKLKHLEASYPMLLKKRQRFDDAKHLKKTEKSSIFTDASTIVKATMEIAKVTDLKIIIQKLLVILLENLNAQKAYFLIEEDNHLKIAAEGAKADSVEVKPLSIMLEDCKEIAQSVVFYVIRTRKQVVLEDASSDGSFSYNKYIRENKPKSILCTPIFSREKLLGILYLENPLQAQAFPPKMVELLNLLLAQVSVSIENTILIAEHTDLSNRFNKTRQKMEKRIQVLEQELESRII